MRQNQPAFFRKRCRPSIQRAPASVAYPPAPENALLREIITRAAGRLTMREILDELDVDTRSRNAVASIRTGTTTAQSPYLVAV